MEDFRMLVQSQDRTVQIKGLNDVAFFLKKIPEELDYRREVEPPSTKVVVMLEVDGHVTRNPPFSRDTPDGRATIESLLKQTKTEKGDFSLNRVTAVFTFYARVRIEFKYPRIDTCKNEEVVQALRDRLEELEKDGFIVTEPAPE